MYGNALRIFTRRSAGSSMQFKVVRNLCVHNLQYPSKRFNLCNFNSVSRNFGRCNVAYSVENVDQRFAVLTGAYKEQGRIYASHILNVLEKSKLSVLTDDLDLLLLRCCGHVMVDRTSQARSVLCDKVWKKLEDCGITFSIQHYNVYLQTCIENRVHLDFENFLSHMKCEPNKETYRLLLDSACEVGDVKQAVKIVAAMKSKRFPAYERVFDALVLGHAINGGLSDAEKVMATMKAAHIVVSPATCFALIRGLAWRNDREGFLHALDMFPNAVQEEELLKLLTALGVNGNHTWLEEMLRILAPVITSKQHMQQLDSLCINLVYAGQPEAAIMFYRRFVVPSTIKEKGTYAFFLLVDMIRCCTPTKIIIDIAKSLQEEELNPVALDNLTGVALKMRQSEIAWELLAAMINLRPHYFWPLLLQTAQKEGEIGILNTLKKMLDWNVRADLDTLEYYSIPLCDSTDPKQLLIRLQNLGFTVRELLTPLLGFLLKKGRVVSAQQLCQTYRSVLQSERLIQPLVTAWCNTEDADNTVEVLEKMCKTAVVPADYTGQFLVSAFRTCRSPASHENFLKLLKIVELKNLRISATLADYFMRRLRSPNYQCVLKPEMEEAVDSLVNASVNYSHSFIPHPRDMGITELENHLTELENKNMETRGVLRRLIQEYSRTGNELKANELRQRFMNSGYNETAGMQAALLQIYVNNNNPVSALNMYYEIKTSHPTFLLDDFKVVDLCTLLVKSDQFETALNILTAETADRKARGGRTIVQNCWRLIGAANNEVQTEKLFHLLVEKGYCVPSNVILGPLVEVHLNKGDLYEAVEVYTICAKKYKCTPLQLELLSAVVKSENENLLQKVLSETVKVRGSETTTVALITALAENGLHKSLRKVLLEAKDISKKELERRCEIWVKDNRLSALETLAQAGYRLPTDIVDQSFVYQCIMQIHSINNNCESAIEFYRQILEKEEEVPQKLVDELLRLVSRCKYEMPEILKTRKVV